MYFCVEYMLKLYRGGFWVKIFVCAGILDGATVGGLVGNTII